MKKQKTIEITHEQLIVKARAWLKNFGCPVVASEVKISAAQCPDALGWRGGAQTVLIECVASRASFLRRKEKRLSKDAAFGDYRLILTVPDVVKDRQELPKGWGLLIYNPSERVISIHENAQFQPDKNIASEIEILLSLLRRIGEYAADAGGGVSISCYKFGTENRAALEVAVMGNYLEGAEEDFSC